MRNLHLTLPVAQYAVAPTPREMAVAELAHLGNADIAQILVISPATVKTHLANIARKTGLESRAAIAVWADRQTRRAA